ncbi:MAG: hypothetical protein EB020_05445 [Proteobacteria bacterium]|nr:hypothetical protein [Pseudomonadota bacterium]NDB20305.1 hypothetical protein [Pseudomonadota bacterium]NDE75243.1 hypothetical protein [Pseudomonadota bacterium]HAN15632.1 hypothetical protein [Chloroflexota bacterium]
MQSTGASCRFREDRFDAGNLHKYVLSLPDNCIDTGWYPHPIQTGVVQTMHSIRTLFAPRT